MLKNVTGKYRVAILVALLLMVSCSTPATPEKLMTITETYGNNLKTTTATPSATVAPTSFPSETPLPTLSPTQMAEVIRELYAHNGSCELPCLWGIVPGKTLLQDVHSKFSQIGSFDDITRPFDSFQIIVLTTSPPNDLIGIYDDNSWSFHLRVTNNVVMGILAGVTNIENFSVPSLANFLAYFGKPDDIKVRVIEAPSEGPDYQIILYYPSKGVFIRWRGDTKYVLTQTSKNITVMACPQSIPTEADNLYGLESPSFYLFSLDKKMPFDEIIEKHLSEDPAGTYQSLDKAELEKFYTMYLDPAAEDCFPFYYSFSP